MNETQARYDRVLAALNASTDEADDPGHDAPRVYGGLSPYAEVYSSLDLLAQYRSGAGSPFRGEIVKPGDR